MDFSNHFLIAMPTLSDPNFAATVTYVINHGEDGAMGVVINQPTEYSVADVLNSLDLSAPTEPTASQPVMRGGPVEPQRGIVLHRSDSRYESSIPIDGTLTVTTSRDVLDLLSEDKGPDDFLLALGYAGWSSGQLEHEIGENSWLTCRADSRIVFDVPPERRLDEAAALLGIDLARIDPQAGHA